MDPFTILTLALRYGPIVKGLIDEATSNQDLTSKLKASAAPLASLLEGIGAQFFPKVAPELHIAAVAMASFDPSVTKWLQRSLNQLVTPSPNLVVDGQYGPRTRAAVEAIQTQLSLKIDGFAGQLTQAAIAAMLARLQ